MWTQHEMEQTILQLSLKSQKTALCERSPRCRKLRNKIVYTMYLSGYGNCDLVDLYSDVPDLNFD